MQSACLVRRKRSIRHWREPTQHTTLAVYTPSSKQRRDDSEDKKSWRKQQRSASKKRRRVWLSVLSHPGVQATRRHNHERGTALRLVRGNDGEEGVRKQWQTTITKNKNKTKNSLYKTKHLTFHTTRFVGNVAPRGEYFVAWSVVHTHTFVERERKKRAQQATNFLLF